MIELCEKCNRPKGACICKCLVLKEDVRLYPAYAIEESHMDGDVRVITKAKCLWFSLILD